MGAARGTGELLYAHLCKGLNNYSRSSGYRLRYIIHGHAWINFIGILFQFVRGGPLLFKGLNPSGPLIYFSAEGLVQKP